MMPGRGGADVSSLSANATALPTSAGPRTTAAYPPPAPSAGSTIPPPPPIPRSHAVPPPPPHPRSQAGGRPAPPPPQNSRPPPPPPTVAPRTSETTTASMTTTQGKRTSHQYLAANGGGQNGHEAAVNGSVSKRSCVEGPGPAQPYIAVPRPTAAGSGQEGEDVEEGEILEEGELEEEVEVPPAPVRAAAAPQAPPRPPAYHRPPPPPSTVSHLWARPPLSSGYRSQLHPSQQPSPRTLASNRPPPPPPTSRRSQAAATPPPPPQRKQPPPPPPPSTPPAPPRVSTHHRTPLEHLRPDQVSPFQLKLPVAGKYGRSLAAFRDMRVIGKGTYGEVSSAIDASTGEKVAIKKMSISLPGDQHRMEGMAITTMRELKALLKFSHPNIVRLREMVTEAGSAGVPEYIYLVMDFCQMDLAAAVKMCTLTRRHIRVYLYQILKGLGHIQKHNLLHRDLKTANVLVTSNHVVKLADWGLCRFVPDQAHLARLTNPVVTLWYRAPELLMGTHNYSYGVDMWSVGMILAEMMIGRPFLEGKDEMDQLHRIFEVCGTPLPPEGHVGPTPPRKEGRVAQELRTRTTGRRGGNEGFEEAYRLVELMLNMDPKLRPHAESACDDEFLWSDTGEGEDSSDFFDPSSDPSKLPKLVPICRDVNMESMHEWEVKKHPR